MTQPADENRMRLRYDGVCRVCATSLPAGTDAVYERSAKTVRCLTCSSTPDVPVVGADDPRRCEGQPQPDSGNPGASARREHERRQADREQRIREKHPKLGGFILAMSDDPQSTKAWAVGAVGEERLGERLNQLSSETLRVLHDRRIPATRRNIDHLAITPAGVYVIDAKRYRDKRPTLKVEGGLFRPRVEKLLVGSRDHTKLVEGVLRQVDVVRKVIDDDIPVTGVLCFVDADWPLLGGAFTVRGVDILWPKRLYGRLDAAGPFGERVVDVHRQLAGALPSA